jgi:hypothetical protein
MRTAIVVLTAFIFVVLFGKVYMWATRPDVPLPAAAFLQHYAPGVKLGAPVEEAKRSLDNVRYVSHLGFVGTSARAGREPNTSNMFKQVRLLVSARARSRTVSAAQRADIEAVELVTAESGAHSELFQQLIVRFGAPAGTGCLRSRTPGNYREVTYFVTPAKRAGAALINDFGGNADKPYPGQVVVSLIVFSGDFQGGATLRGDYEPRTCRALSRAAS